MAALPTWTPEVGTSAPDDAQRVIASLLRSQDVSSGSLSNRIEEGLPWHVFDELAAALGLTHEAFGALLRVSPSTLYRRRRARRFPADESDRLWRYLNLFAVAVDVLEGRAPAARWLASPQPALGGRTPLEAARDAPGARAAEDLLARLEYGVFG